MIPQSFLIAFLGFGNVLRALAQILLEQHALLVTQYGLDIHVVGIYTRSGGVAIDPNGLDLAQALAAPTLSHLHSPTIAPIRNVYHFITLCPAQVLLEAIGVNPQTGQPASDYCRAALQAGKHVVTANKGPVAFAHRELSALAQQQHRAFFYESTVLDGAPVHSLAREGLLANPINGIQAILNSTTNAILTRMESEISFEAALQEMQAAGTAEADPANDIDGWDAAIKLVILANTLMGSDLRPTDVDRTGIREVSVAQVQAALANQQRLKLVCQAQRSAGEVRLQVRPQALDQHHPLALLDGASSGIILQTDFIKELTLLKSPSSPRSTAYGMLVDLLNIGRGRH
jgi:homoserine dehydrogenase